MKKKSKNYFFDNFYKSNNEEILKKSILNLNRKQIEKKNRYCDGIYSILLCDLANDLNKIHNQKYSLRQWEAIIGNLLREIIYFFYKNFIYLKFLINKHKLKKIFFSQKKNSLQINTSLDMYKLFLSSELYVFSFLQLAKFFYSKKIILKENKENLSQNF